MKKGGAIKMKLKRIVTMVTMMLVFMMSLGTIVLAEDIKQVTFKSNDEKTTAVGTITVDYRTFFKDTGGAATAIDGDSKVYDRRVFTAIYALDGSGKIKAYESKKTDSYNTVLIQAHCKSFKSQHQILSASGVPLAKMKTMKM